ncbi:hypothetical protein F5Y17DRAFT_416071 [Xylariaceae sp. FL0594]|nr:hypothetical protein F5Y17DRAFT_416071 [Xylariaceae sp. FL0594]
MDDPWGSPWASADTASKADAPPSELNTFSISSPPPKALLFGNGARLPSHSLWSDDTDDTGSNAWATTSSLDATDPHNDWGIWESGEQRPRLSPRLSVPTSKESYPPWPENIAKSPVLLPNSRSRTPSLLRHHSPDPWASDLARNNDIYTTPESPPASNASDTGTPTIETGAFTEIPITLPSTIHDGITADSQAAGSRAEGLLASYEADETGEAGLIRSQLAQSASELRSSRPSSTFSIDSQDGLEHQDSPITSIDEDRAFQARSTSRKSSGMVQELVGVYNSLTSAASEELLPLERRAMSHARNHGDLTVQDRTARTEVLHLSDTQAVSFDVQPEPSQLGEASPISDLSSKPRAAVEEEAVQFPAVSFDIDLALVDQLFPVSPQPLGETPPDEPGVSEHIITDSFTTIAERKAWYRISRYGSMCKHNLGNDENYLRVTWPTSQLHKEVISIVRRWMEQDSYAGKATLGGTKRTGFFDWDSDVAPVELEKVFRRRGSVVRHTRTASIPTPPSNNSSQILQTDKHAYRNSTGLVLRAVGRDPLPPSGLNVSISKPLSGPSEGASTSTSPTGTVQNIQPNEDDEDDWGEMVSSPQAAEFLAWGKSPASPDRGIITPCSPTWVSQPDKSVHSGFPVLLEPNLARPEAEPHQPTSKPSDGLGTPDDTIGVFESTPERDSHPIMGQANNRGASEPGIDVPAHHIDQDSIVQRILDNLPDLSYMLR